jgi:hypothetical protein
MAPLAQTAAVAAGLAAVTTGYVTATVTLHHAARRHGAGARPARRTAPATPYRPACVLDYRLGGEFPAVPGPGPTGPYRRAVVLVRDGVDPLGLVEIDLDVHTDAQTRRRAVNAALEATAPRRTAPAAPGSGHRGTAVGRSV